MKLVDSLAAAVLVAAALVSAGCPNESRNDSIRAANEGAKAYGQKQYDTAITAYKRATEKWNENHVAWYGLGAAYSGKQDWANEGAKAYGQKQYDTAITAYKRATEKWNENHVAWYGLGAAYSGKQDWANASDAMAHAVQTAPEQGMYQLLYGWFLYEKAIRLAREDQARRENKKPEEVNADLTSVNFEKPLQHLQEAVKLNPDLWRAHYCIGRIYRDTGKSKEAADELNRALQSAPTEPGPWVALAELYRQWDYPDPVSYT